MRICAERTNTTKHRKLLVAGGNVHEYTLKLCPAHKIDLDMIGRLEKVEDKRTRSVVDDTSLTSQTYIHTTENGPSDFSNVGVVLQQTEDLGKKHTQQSESRQIVESW